MKGLVSILCLLLLSACSSQARLKSFYRYEARIKPPPTLSKRTLKPQTVKSPCYPVEAAIHNAEGWVQLEFSVADNGAPVAIETKDSSPEGLFEQCAVKAFEQWTFAPQAKGRQQRFQFLFQFRLDS